MALKVAVVGAGNIGRIHAAAYSAHDLSNLVAVCDLVEAKAQDLARAHSARCCTTVEHLLASEDLDIVSVATAGEENGGDHFDPVMAALDAGKHVLCEKPLSNDIGNARRMVAAARNHDLRLGVDLNHRFVPAAERARRLITDGSLGEPLFVNMNLWIRNPRESSPWFHLRALHSHSVDVMRFFCGDVARVHAFALQAPGRKIWSVVSINLEFTSGAVGHLTGSYDMSNLHPIERCEVGGTRGRFVIDNVYQELTFYPHESDELLVVRNSIMGGVTGFPQTIHNRIHRFLQQVTDGDESLEASGEEGLAAQEVVEAAIESINSGSVIDVPAVLATAGARAPKET